MAEKEKQPDGPREDAVQVLFTRSVTTKEVKPRTFEEGEVYEMPRASAEHFVKRGQAKLAEEKDAHQPEPVKGADLPEHLQKEQDAIKERKEKAAQVAKDTAKPAPEKAELPARAQSERTGAVKGTTPPANVTERQAQKPAQPGGTGKPSEQPPAQK